MDEMKPAPEIDAAMREIIQRRDRALSKELALSSRRRTVLADFLARELPVETTLRELAMTRDEALHQSPAKISAAVEATLCRDLAGAEQTSGANRFAFWLSCFRSPLAAGLIGCAVITAAFLGLSRREAARSVTSLPPMPAVDKLRFESGMEPFTRTAAFGSFNLNTNEPASLQASFLVNSRIHFADDNDTSLSLRLDLPVRAALMEDGLSRTP
jgi:hypothetical protein